MDLELVNKGISNMRAGNFDQAEQFYNEAIALEGPNLYRALYNKGVLYHYHLNRMKEALTYYKKALALKPDYGYAWNNLGNVLCHFMQFDEARKMFEHAVQEMPDEALPLYGLAFALNRLNAFSKSIDILDKLLEKDNLNEELLVKINSELGIALLQTNQASKAYEHFKKAFEIDENDYQVCYNIAFIADGFQNYEEALSFYDKAIALNSFEAKGYQGKACTYIHTKRYQDGLSWIQKAIELNPENFEAFYNLACIYAGLGKEKELFDTIEKTLDLAPPQIQIAKHILNDPDFLPYTKQANFVDLLENNR